MRDNSRIDDPDFDYACDSYDYSPNELANLAESDNSRYRQIVESNLEDNDSVEDWEQRNLDRAKKYLSK